MKRKERRHSLCKFAVCVSLDEGALSYACSPLLSHESGRYIELVLPAAIRGMNYLIAQHKAAIARFQRKQDYLIMELSGVLL